MVLKASLCGAATALALCLGCNAEVEENPDTGVSQGSHGFVVVNSDYRSSSVSLLDTRGELATLHLIGSASASAGLSAAFSGDVMPPSFPGTSAELVLLDRFPAAVISWISLEQAQVRAQLSVATGFISNPHDYVHISKTKAYVTRFAPNFAAGDEPFDGGNDVLIIDPSRPKIVGRIDLMPILAGEPAGYYPRASRAVLLGKHVLVLAVGHDRSFKKRLDSRLISIDSESDEVSEVHVFTGLTNCSSLALAPNQSELTIACSGDFNQDATSELPDSALVRVSVAGGVIRELDRFSAANLGGAKLSSVDYSGPESVVYTTYGQFTADRKGVVSLDTLRHLDLSTGRMSDPLYQVSRIPFSLGDIRCRIQSSTCVLTDAETDGGVLRRYRIESTGTLKAMPSITTDPGTGLPPRYLGLF